MPAAADRPSFDPPVVRLDDLSDVVTAVPYLLGFQPAESVVAIALSGPRERISFTMRLDLVPEEHDDDTARLVVESMTRAEAVAVFLFVFTAALPGDGLMPRERLVDTIMTRLQVPLREAVLVGAERIWSYLCADHCCPPEGRPRSSSTPAALNLAAAHALYGNAVLPSREALVASLAPPDGPLAEILEHELDEAVGRRAVLGRRGARKEARALLDILLDRCEEPPVEVTAAQASTLVLALHDGVFRDVALRSCLDRGPAMRLLMSELARLALPPLDTPVCTLVAVLAYLDGDGALARTALDRALDSNPEFMFANLLSEMLLSQMSPAELRRGLEESVKPRRHPSDEKRMSA